MSSRTPTKSSEPEETIQLSKVIDLSSQAISLIRENQRSRKHVETLIRALELFKQRRLGSVLATARMSTSSPREVSRAKMLCLKEIASLSFSARTHRYLKERGIFYLGEMVNLQWDHRIPYWSDVEQVLNQVGFPTQFTPGILRWQPAYFDDPDFIANLSRPIDEVMSDFDFRQILHEQNRHYVGDLFRWRDEVSKSKYSCTTHRAKTLQELFDPSFGLRGAMLVPDEWSPPDGIPTTWQEIVRRTSTGSPIFKVYFSIKIRNYLIKADILTFEELQETTADQLLQIPGLRMKSLRKLSDDISRLGKSLHPSVKERLAFE